MDWYFTPRDKAFAFFGGRGHRILIGAYYDKDDITQTRQWLESARKSNGVVGIMYTTWERNYGQLENFSKTVKEIYP